MGHAFISDMEVWLELEAKNILKVSYNKPALSLNNILLRASQTNMIIKAGDLSNHITSFIGVMRDDYTSFLAHELRGTFFNATSKVLEDLFADYQAYYKITDSNVY
jgi:hypothetical protein